MKTIEQTLSYIEGYLKAIETGDFKEDRENPACKALQTVRTYIIEDDLFSENSNEV